MNRREIRIAQITEALDAIKNPHPIQKIGPNTWIVTNGTTQWAVAAGAVDVDEFNKTFRVMTASFVDQSTGSYGVTGKSNRQDALKLYGSIIKILQQFKDVDIIAFKPDDDPASKQYAEKVSQKGRIYYAVGRYCVSSGYAFFSGKLTLDGIGEVNYVLPLKSKAIGLTDMQLEAIILAAWVEKHDPLDPIIDADGSEDEPVTAEPEVNQSSPEATPKKGK